MTDNEIIKALEWYKKLECGICYDVGMLCHIGGGDCIVTLAETTLDLLNRQQAEIDRLSVYNEEIVNRIRKSAIKEFAEKLKANRPHLNTGEQVFYIRPEEVDNLVKEMVGADNDISK